MSEKKKITLEELDRLSPGISKCIRSLLYQPSGQSSFLMKKEVVKKLLSEINIGYNEIIVDGGHADRKTAQEAINDIMSEYQFADQFGN